MQRYKQKDSDEKDNNEKEGRTETSTDNNEWYSTNNITMNIFHLGSTKFSKNE